MRTKTIIVGGGISGLYTAYKLASRNEPFILLEARDRLGGRIFSPSAYDLGPSWFWPGQALIENLIRELGLWPQVYLQYAEGDSLYQRADTKVLRGMTGFSMAGSYRIQGGLFSIVEALAKAIDDLVGNEWVYLGNSVNSIEKSAKGLQVKTNERSITARSIVLALPPRVALQTISFEPKLSPARIAELKSIETWMAGHAKLVVEYRTPFWRENGLSGDVISEVGPLGEIHDASLERDKRYALFGFLSLQPKQRQNRKVEIERLAIAQLERLFGEPAKQPVKTYFQDWAGEKNTATPLDHRIQSHHPLNEWAQRSEKDFENRLIWSGSEAAEGQMNGYIEGALLASEVSLAALT